MTGREGNARLVMKRTPYFPDYGKAMGAVYSIECHIINIKKKICKRGRLYRDFQSMLRSKDFFKGTGQLLTYF